MKWLVLPLVILMGLSNSGGRVKLDQFKGNVRIYGNLDVGGEINKGLVNQVQAATAAIGQLETTGFLGDLNVRGTLYQQLGQNWVGPIANPFGVNNIQCVAYGNGVFVAGGAAKKIARSLDNGATWGALIANPFAAGSIVMSVAYGGGYFVAVTFSGEIAFSTDGAAPWTAAVGNPFGGLAIYSVTYGNGVFVAVGASKQIGYSLDHGQNWALVANPFAIGSIIESVSFGNNVFVAVDNGGEIARSVNLGLGWGAAVIANPFGGTTIYTITFGNGVFVAGGITGKLARSIDNGLSWGVLITNPMGVIYSLTFNFNVFQVFGDIAGGGGSSRSYDNGLTWSVAINPFGPVVRGSASGPSDIVAVGDGASIATAGWNAAYSLVVPVPTEPSLGTPHPHSIQFITAGAQNVGTQDYDLATDYPTGIKMLWVWGFWTTGAGGGGYIYVENSAGLPGGIGFTPSAAIPGQVFGLVVLNADRKVRLVVGNNNASAMNFWAQLYWM